MIHALQEQVDKTNVMLVELELEGEIVNQSWHEYDKCCVTEAEEGFIRFAFAIQGRRAGAFMTYKDNIQKYELFEEEETVAGLRHFYLHTKGKKSEPLLSDGMFRVFNNEVPLRASFHIGELYNPNREQAKTYDKELLNLFFKNDLFEIHPFEITPVEVHYENKLMESYELGKLREYAREDENTLKAMLGVINTIKKAGIEVSLHERLEGENAIPSINTRAYVSEWNLIISPSTQRISTLLNTFAQRDKKVCVVSHSHDNSQSKILVYLIKRKKKFFDTYEHVLEENLRRMAEAHQKYFEASGFNDL